MDNGPHLRTARGRPKSVASSHESSAGSARNRTGHRGREGEMGARDNGEIGEKRKQHAARCLSFSNHCNNSHDTSNSNNSSSSNDRSSKRRNASAVAGCSVRNLSYRLKANEFADLVKFAFRYSGEEYVGQSPVNVVDWTLIGALTPVKNREQCDSCWTSLLCHWVWRLLMS